MKIYIAGAWIEQHSRARPMIAKVREAGLVVTHDWTQAEGDVCACGYHRNEHAESSDDPGSYAGCSMFNGIGVGSDSQLTVEQRRRFAQEDLDGVLTADIVWLLAANTKGACGSWVELGVALALRELRRQAREGGGTLFGPRVIVSGPKARRTIFTELADRLFDTDEGAFEHIVKYAGRWPCGTCGVRGHKPQDHGGCDPTQESGG